MHSITCLHRDNNTYTTDKTEHATFDNCTLRVIEDLRIKYIPTQDKKSSSSLLIITVRTLSDNSKLQLAPSI